MGFGRRLAGCGTAAGVQPAGSVWQLSMGFGQIAQAFGFAVAGLGCAGSGEGGVLRVEALLDRHANRVEQHLDVLAAVGSQALERVQERPIDRAHGTREHHAAEQRDLACGGHLSQG